MKRLLIEPESSGRISIETTTLLGGGKDPNDTAHTLLMAITDISGLERDGYIDSTHGLASALRMAADQIELNEAEM